MELRTGATSQTGGGPSHRRPVWSRPDAKGIRQVGNRPPLPSGRWAVARRPPCRTDLPSSVVFLRPVTFGPKWSVERAEWSPSSARSA